MGSQLLIVIAVFLSICTIGLSHPKQTVTDSTVARRVFDYLTNGTGGKLTFADFKQLLDKFDVDGNGMLTSDEFLGVWVRDGVGPPLDAVVFFHNADVNKDGVLTAKSDLLAIFQSFDRDGSKTVDQGEFVVQWVKLSTL